MKRLLCLIAVMATIGVVNAQVSFYPLKKQDTLRNKAKQDSLIVTVPDSSKLQIGVYGGMFIGVEVPVDRVKAIGSVNFLAGVSMSYKLTSWMSVNSWAGLQLNSDATTLHAERFWIKIQPLKKVSIELGAMASIPTEQRPLWITGDGQFEPVTLQQIPGGSIGMKIKYQITKDWGIAGGVTERNKEPEYSARVNYKKMILSGWYSQWENKFGAALSLKFKPLSTTLVWNQDKRISNILVVNLPKGWCVYSDTGFDLSTNKLVRAEWGILFCHKWGLHGAAWNNENKAIELYCQINL